MPTVLIAGGTGLIGTRLSKLLQARGYKVNHLSRTRDLHAAFPAYQWDLNKGTIDAEAVQTADYVINLAGAGIADKRWTTARKKLIIESRVQSAELLLQAFEEQDHAPKAYLSSAAVGYYGDRGAEWLDEESAPGQGFLPESCIAWEEAIQGVAETSLRTVALRIGIVLSTRGGAMEKMMLPMNFAAATYFGDGSQYYSWIHIEDLCRMFIWALENEKAAGFYNAVAPEPVTNKELTKTLGEAMDKPSVLVPAPAFALRLAMGEMADAILSSARVSSQKVVEAGFEFAFTDLLEAMRDLIRRKI
jgi:uncharacterized protein (TIGR01777 family)